MNTVAIIGLLDVILMLAARIPAMKVRFQAIKDELASMQSEGRDPTDDEWEEIGNSIDDRIARIKRAGPPTARA